jgi:hypothetical protein
MASLKKHVPPEPCPHLPLPRTGPRIELVRPEHRQIYGVLNPVRMDTRAKAEESVPG